MKMRIFSERRIKKILITVGILVGLIYALFPIMWMLSCSLKSNTEVFRVPQKMIPRDIIWTAYQSVLSDPGKLKLFLNSYVVALATTAVTLFVAILAAFAFSRYEFRMKKSLNVFIIMTQAVPPITLLIPFFGLVVALNVYDTYWAMIMTYLVFTLPYAIIMMTGYFNTLPKELDEAVQIDGGLPRCTLWRILVPISTPGIVATAIYTFLQCWNEYLYALCLTKTESMRTVPIGIQLLMGQVTYSWNEMMAMSILGSVPIVILFIFVQKYFIAGLTAGAVKG
ncbi:MAG: carbohydrate ABC transporter permease [Clostridia bacterium]